jgi:hypothetical protein
VNDLIERRYNMADFYEGFVWIGSLEHRKAMAYIYDNPEAYLTPEEIQELTFMTIQKHI